MASAGASRVFITRSFKGRDIESSAEKIVESPRAAITGREYAQIGSDSFMRSTFGRTFSTLSFARAAETASNSAADAKEGEKKEEGEKTEAGEGEVECDAEKAELELKVEELSKEVEDLKDRYLRSVAEADNTRRRASIDVDNARKYALTSFAKELLDVSDNLNRALESVKIPDGADIDPQLRSLHEGVTLTQRVMHNIMGKHGVVKMESVGVKFDPNLHNAMMQVPQGQVPNVDGGCVAYVLKEGYMINDRVLRAADVGVVSEN
eukprot:CAMPEP_0113873002 /NCGR_PEP_ID=MMETSP0780_2-20120614/3529_1 /TAXON_ID=652834 /ORGANISM="Palpitomonas bilix" /LENGTH=264 /DNA_ID=CAMNT_0000858601 /DNA_START=189 /DNA_END=983 /DNA_ORIENTATION=- /assembly_acc=CAM_ASM_000599